MSVAAIVMVGLMGVGLIGYVVACLRDAPSAFSAVGRGLILLGLCLGFLGLSIMDLRVLLPLWGGVGAVGVLCKVLYWILFVFQWVLPSVFFFILVKCLAWHDD